MIRRFLGKQQALEIFLDFSQYFYILEISQGFGEDPAASKRGSPVGYGGRWSLKSPGVPTPGAG